MTAQAGIHFLLKLGSRAAQPRTLAGLRATQMRLDNDLIDTTHKDSLGSRTLLAQAGTQKLTVTASGLFTNQAVEEETRLIAFQKRIETYCLFFPNGDVLESAFYISHYERSGDYNGEETYSLTLESSGLLNYAKQQKNDDHE